MITMVSIEVRGNTRRFRDVLRNTYDLRWNHQSFCYGGEMALSERRIRNLVRFCEKFNLEIKVDGILYQSGNKEDDDIESFSIEPVASSKVSALGKVGTETLLPPKTEDEAPGYQELLITADSEIDFDN